jgi:ACS family tartrate transporter-like MFS transporter
MNGVLGLEGWKWLFIFEGAPSVILGFITYYYLTDSPGKAKWLEPNEREWLQAQIDKERVNVESVRKYTLGQALLNPRVLALGLVYFTLQSGIYGVNMWLPTIIKRFGNLTTFQIGLIAAIPFIVAAIGMLIWGYSSDRKLERKWHLTVALLLGSFGLLGSALFSHNPVLTIVLLSLSSIGVFATMPVFWTVPPIFLTGTAAAGGIALINSCGGLGGFAGPFMVGWIRDATGSFIYGLVFLGVCVLVGAIVAYQCCQRVQRTAAETAKASAQAAGR